MTRDAAVWWRLRRRDDPKREKGHTQEMTLLIRVVHDRGVQKMPQGMQITWET